MLVKEFASEEEVDMCYLEYAQTVGFGIRKHNKRINIKGISPVGRGCAAERDSDLQNIWKIEIESEN